MDPSAGFVDPGYVAAWYDASADMGEWGMPQMKAQSVPNASRALAIRNPKTGEVIGGSKVLDEASHSQRLRKMKIDSAKQALLGGTSLESVLAKAKGFAAAKVVAKRVGAARWCADHSTFSALNIDGNLDGALRGRGGPLRGDLPQAAQAKPTPTVSKSTPSAAGDISAGLLAQKGQGGPLPLLPLTAKSTTIGAKAAATLAALSLEPGSSPAPRGVEDAGNSAAELAAPVVSSGAEAIASKKVEDAGLSTTATPWRPKPRTAPSAVLEDEVGEQSTSSPESSGAADDDADVAESADTEEGEKEEEDPSRLCALQTRSEEFKRFLAYRLVADEAAPAEIETLTAQEVDQRKAVSLSAPPVISSLAPRTSNSGGSTKASGASWRKPSFHLDAASPQTAASPGTPAAATDGERSGTSRASQRKERSERRVDRDVMTPSANAYRAAPGKEKSHVEDLKRSLNSLLNKICPENVATIGNRVAEVEVRNVEELEMVISIFFAKALAEPHYCETYADLVFVLKTAFPEFPNPEGSKPVTFKSTLLDICQREFEAMPTSFKPTKEDEEKFGKEEIEFRRKKAKDRVLANMKFIGHLFLRQLLSAKVIGSVIQELTLCNRAQEVPQEHVIECACELLTNIGYTLDAMPAGAHALTQVCGRLKELKGRKGENGKLVLSKRVQFQIQDLLDIRSAGWAKKTFKTSAKTKEEIRLEQSRELAAAAKGKEVDGAERVIVGKRPMYVA